MREEKPQREREKIIRRIQYFWSIGGGLDGFKEIILYSLELHLKIIMLQSSYKFKLYV
jgi:hypothetical protein